MHNARIVVGMYSLVLDTHCRVATDTKSRDVVCKSVDTTASVGRNQIVHLNNNIHFMRKLRYLNFLNTLRCNLNLNHVYNTQKQ